MSACYDEQHAVPICNRYRATQASSGETRIFTRKSSYCFQRILAIAILSVRHTGGSVKNSASEDHQIFTIGCLEDSSFRNRKAFP